jgi:hypothetical protein
MSSNSRLPIFHREKKEEERVGSVHSFRKSGWN